MALNVPNLHTKIFSLQKPCSADQARCALRIGDVWYYCLGITGTTVLCPCTWEKLGVPNGDTTHA